MDEIFGAQLRAIRQEQGLTQEQLGERVGTTGKRISYYETGVREPYLSTIRQLATVLHVEPGRLLEEGE